MKITEVTIKNFRAFKDATIKFDEYNCFVGANGSGKSTVFQALNLFFRNPEGSLGSTGVLEKEDFHNLDTSQPISITVTFENLPAEAQEDFKDYFRNGKLIITALARFDEGKGGAETIQIGNRLGMESFRRYFDADKNNEKVPVLQAIYADLVRDNTGLPSARTKSDMAEALRQHEAAHPEKCVLIPSEDQFYGVSKGQNRLEKYIQWVFMPAVKDASNEQLEAKNTAIGKLLARTVRSRMSFDQKITELKNFVDEKYRAILNDNQPALKSISNSLNSRISSWAHAGARLRLEWQHDVQKSIKIESPYAQVIAGEGTFDGNILRFGHGFQRSYLLALLEELASYQEKNYPKLILACEEPELYQHPPQAKHLSDTLVKLSSANSQVMVCSHSPYFVSGKNFEEVRLARKCPYSHAVTIKHATHANLSQRIAAATGEAPVTPAGNLIKLYQSLQSQINEMFFASKLILVEGREDVAYITSYLNLLGHWDKFRRLGCHIIPTDGKNHAIRPLATALELEIPTFLVFDCDGDTPHPTNLEKHRKDNTALLKLLGIATPNPFPANDVFEDNYIAWKKNIGTSVEADFQNNDWQNYANVVEAKYGQPGGLNKNSIFIAETLDALWTDAKKSHTLEKVCTKIIEFAER